MTRAFLAAGAAEVIKLRTLPSVLATVTGTIGAAIILAATLTATRDTHVSVVAVVAESVPFLQIGAIVLGVLGVASEYAGCQIHTTLAAVPHRMVVLAGKAVAYLAVSLLASGAALVAASATTSVVSGAHGAMPAPGVWARQMAAATAYLTLIGLLAQVVAVILRSLTAPLVAMLGLVLIISPLLRTLTGQARWLPDHATQHLHLVDVEAAPTPWSGMPVLTAWIAAIGLAACVRFLRRDA